jgi:hypothetical protein
LKQAQRIVNRAGAADAEVIQHLPWG